MTSIRAERPQDGPLIETLLDLTFGAERHARPSYCLRDGIAPLGGLCFVAETGDRIVGTIRYWPILIGQAESALLLGPIAVDPAHEGRGIGGDLIRTSLAEATEAGHDLVLAVGAPDYLGRFGFVPAGRHGICFPALDDPRRLLALALVPGVLDKAGGALSPISQAAAVRCP
jgi:predicted N-acetyltransferase YhbS